MNDQEKINLLAKKYSEEKKTGNENNIRNIRNELWIAVFNSRDIMRMIISKYSNWNLGCIQIFNQSDLIDEAMYAFPIVADEYEYDDKNSNFTMYFLMRLRRMISDKLKKERSVKGVMETENEDGKKKKQPFDRRAYSFDEKKGSDDEGMTYGDSLIDHELSPEEQTVSEDNACRVRNQLLMLVIRFYETRKGRQANPSRLSYYRIFVTESVITEIKSDQTSAMYNQQEAMQAIDSGFVNFALKFKGSCEFKKLDDIVYTPVKHYCDIFDGGKDEELKLDHEAKPIIEYRFRAGMDEKRVSDAAITPHRKAFIQEVQSFLQ